MPNFTPGPWGIKKEDWDYRVPFFTILSGGDAVCDIMHMRSGEIEADANLIAAAPDLYAACKALLAPFECDECYDDHGGVSDVWCECPCHKQREEIEEQARAAIAKADGLEE